MNDADLFKTRKDALAIIQNQALTYEQQGSQLAKLAENQLPYPEEADALFHELFEEGILCDLGEGHAPYAPRYVLPDYDRLLKKGSAFLRLDPPKTLTDVLNTLLIFYHHVPSVTRYPVYLGNIDKMIDPYIDDETQARKEIRWFLLHLDRTINDSFCHANLGPEETLAGNIILDLVKELENVTPNLTLLYNAEKTSDAFAAKAVWTSLYNANPAFANDAMFREDFHGDYGIASCYNGLPIGGGAFTLSRMRLNKVALRSHSQKEFMEEQLPLAANAMIRFMEGKIRFLVEETPFFESNFLVKEGFIHLDNFVGLFGVVGMHECVQILMEKEGKDLSYGRDDEANQLAIAILDRIQTLVNAHRSKYSTFWNHRFMMHAQVGAQDDLGTSPGVRIAIGEEIALYSHLRQAGLFHKYFPSGIGDHFPFETTARNNPEAVLDVFKGGFQSGMRYISAYAEDGDLIRVTGYLVKKSDLLKYKEGGPVSYDTVQYADDALTRYGVLDRKVRGTDATR